MTRYLLAEPHAPVGGWEGKRGLFLFNNACVLSHLLSLQTTPSQRGLQNCQVMSPVSLAATVCSHLAPAFWSCCPLQSLELRPCPMLCDKCPHF